MDKEKIKEIIGQLTLKEKAGLCSGASFWHTKAIERVGVPAMMVSDGPHGLRKQASKSDMLGINKSIVATCFPTGVGIAASFDRGVAKRLGEALGDEALDENLGVVLGPAINMKRSPLCGRNFEYMSEDPYLAGELSAEYVNGVQSRGVGVSVKHFAVNSQEKFRMTISAEVDERTLREIYLPAFENTVKKANPWTIMCAYNKINGEYCSENKWLLTDVLRNEWGFNGFVVSDWGAVNDRVKGVAAGLELEMPGTGGRNDRKLVQAVESGKLDEKILDQACERVLRVVFDSIEKKQNPPKYDREKEHLLARNLARETMVLLKNEGNILPLKKDKKYAFIGAYAKTPRYQGGGSSHINSYKVVGAWDAATDIQKEYAKGYQDGITEDQKLISEAVETARKADIAIVFAGLPEVYESEGFDRRHMNMPKSHLDLIEAVSKANPNTVVVLHNGSPVEMPWIKDVKAVLEAYLGGEAVGEATYDILFGDVNPSGKLAETFPISVKDVASSAYYPGFTKTVEYREGLYVGYRYFDKKKKEVLFPFGHGLSYTNFEYSDIKVDKKSLKDPYELIVSFKIKNTGEREGKEVCQVYVKDVTSTVYRPEKELKGFDKISLNAGEEKEVEVKLDKRSFAFYNTITHNWEVESGEFEILVGASSADIRLSTKIEVEGDAKEMSDDKNLFPSYYSGDVENIKDEEFSALIAREISEREFPEGYKFTVNNNLYDARHTGWGKLITKLAVMATSGQADLGDPEIMAQIALQTPMEAMCNFSKGVLSEKMLYALLDLLNGDKPTRAFFRLLGGVFTIPYYMRKAKKNDL
jgi:beta-glucosidase